MKLNAVLVSVSSAKSTYNYGQQALTQLRNADRRGLLRVGIPADIPVNAVVTKADLVLTVPSNTLTGSRDLRVQPLSAPFRVSTADWENQPGVTGTQLTVAVPAGSSQRSFVIDVTDHVQDWISGAATNRGWRLSTDDTSMMWVRGAVAATGQPYLDLEYVVPGDPPFDLVPNGAAVSIAKPVVQFGTAGTVTEVQVQVDPAADEVTPDYDSDPVAASAGLLDLARTDLPGGVYAGLSAGATTFWRARYNGPAGWSDWSDWAEFSRETKTTVTITSPGSTTGDLTPPITWTAADQVTWRAKLLNAATNKVLADSGPVTSSALAWTPPKGLTRVGEQGIAVVEVIDDVDRVATPGDPIEATDTQTFTVVASGVASGPTSLDATVTGVEVEIEAGGPTPDEWQWVRNDVWIARTPGAENVYTDRTAPMGVMLEYEAFPVSGGVVSPNSPVETATIPYAGTWLVDAETGDAVMIVDDEVLPTMLEQAVVHNVIGAPPVRRVSGVLPPSGTVAGSLVDGAYGTADSMYETALSWKRNTPDHEYRLLFDNWNIPVTIGDLAPTPAFDGKAHVYLIFFAWWQTDAELPWEV